MRRPHLFLFVSVRPRRVVRHPYAMYLLLSPILVPAAPHDVLVLCSYLLVPLSSPVHPRRAVRSLGAM
jgi:hypothetical protein